MAARKAIHKEGVGHSSGKSAARQRWEKRRARLLECIANVEANPGMQDDAWVAGQVRYFRQLLANLDHNEPTH